MQRYACMMRGLAHAWVCSLTGPDMAGEVVVKVKTKQKEARTHIAMQITNAPDTH